LKERDQGSDIIARQVPPGAVEESGNRFVIEPVPHHPRRYTGHHRVGWHITADHGARGDDRAGADGHAGQNERPGANPHVMADDDIAARLMVGPHECFPPEVAKGGERIGGDEVATVVATEHDLDPVGDGAVASDGELVAPIGEAYLRPSIGIGTDDGAVVPDEPPEMQARFVGSNESGP